MADMGKAKAVLGEAYKAQGMPNTAERYRRGCNQDVIRVVAEHLHDPADSIKEACRLLGKVNAENNCQCAIRLYADQAGEIVTPAMRRLADFSPRYSPVAALRTLIPKKPTVEELCAALADAHKRHTEADAAERGAREALADATNAYHAAKGGET